MPLTGEYEPSTFGFSRDQVDLYERSGGTEGTAHPGGEPVIVLTSVGAKTGKLRKTPLMRVEHDGEYAVVASLGGAPKHPVWYYNLTANPQVELQDGRSRRTTRPGKSTATSTRSGSSGPLRPGRTTPSTRRRPPGRCPFSSLLPSTRSNRRREHGRLASSQAVLSVKSVRTRSDSLSFGRMPIDGACQHPLPRASVIRPGKSARRWPTRHRPSPRLTL